MKKLSFLLTFALLFGCVPPIARAGTSNVTVNNLTGALNMGQMGAGVNKGFTVPSAYSIEFLSGSTFKIDAGATVIGVPTVGGSPGEIFWNNAGTLDTVPGFAWNGTFNLKSRQSSNTAAPLLDLQNISSGTSAVTQFRLLNDAGSFIFGLSSSAFSGAIIAGAPSGQSAAIYSFDDIPIIIGQMNAARVIVKSTGVAIQGTTTNDNAAAGYVGEFVGSTVLSGSAVSLTSGTVSNVTSISLTAGDWDVWTSNWFTQGAATVPTLERASVSTTSATFDFTPDRFTQTPYAVTGSSADGNIQPIRTRVILTTTTNLYLCELANFSGGTFSAFGGIYARRVR